MVGESHRRAADLNRTMRRHPEEEVSPFVVFRHFSNASTAESSDWGAKVNHWEQSFRAKSARHTNRLSYTSLSWLALGGLCLFALVCLTILGIDALQ